MKLPWETTKSSSHSDLRWGEKQRVGGEGRGFLGGVPFFLVNVFLHGGLFGESVLGGQRCTDFVFLRMQLRVEMNWIFCF